MAGISVAVAHHSQLTSATGPDGLEIRREYDEWGNQLNEENPHQLQQLIRLPGQQYDGGYQACIITATAIMTRCGGGISLRIRLG